MTAAEERQNSCGLVSGEKYPGGWLAQILDVSQDDQIRRDLDKLDREEDYRAASRSLR